MAINRANKQTRGIIIKQALNPIVQGYLVKIRSRNSVLLISCLSFMLVDYRHPDYVYFETSSTSPYQIRRIEELNKTASGNVEAKVMCFYRRRDLPTPLVQLADKHQSEYPALVLACFVVEF